jgi:hypothetical protein
MNAWIFLHGMSTLGLVWPFYGMSTLKDWGYYVEKMSATCSPDHA